MTDLQISVEALDGLERRMTVTIPAAQIEKKIDDRLLKVGRTAKLKGFRPGKVPAKVVRQHYGAQVRDEVIQEMIQSSYSEAIDQEQLRPAALPKLEPGDAQAEADFAYSATFEIFPDVKVSDVSGIKLEQPETEIQDSDVDEMLETLQKQRADWEPADRKSVDGDKVKIDFVGTLKGEPFEGGTAEDFEVIVGDGQMVEDFDKGLVGLTVGEEKTFNVKFAKDYHSEELAGKKVSFAVTAKEISQPKLPELDEEFVKSFGIESGDIEELKTDIRENMEREAEAMIKADVKRQVMEQLLKANPIAVPQALVREETEAMRAEAARNLGTEDVNDPRVPPEDSYTEAAERRVRLSLLVTGIIQEQNVEVDRDRVSAKVDEMCAPYDKPEEFKKLYFQNPQLLGQIENMVIEEQVVEWLVSQGKVKSVTKSFNDLRNT